MNSCEKGWNGIDGGGEGEYKYFRDANETKRGRQERVSDGRKDALKTEKSMRQPVIKTGCSERKELLKVRATPAAARLARTRFTRLGSKTGAPIEFVSAF